MSHPEERLDERRTTTLRRLVESPEMAVLMEAHNGLSARVVEEAGFQGIWASGLAVSAALGVRDSNEASWTQVLEVAEFMADATRIPILLDGDTGFGDFNNVRRVVGKLEQRGVAGICLEDKTFPKRNSFAVGRAQALAPIDEFAGKIQAATDARTDPDFMVVARIEAFIAGCGLSEALRRAEAYRRAGADALLIHSRERTPDQVFSFLEAWEGRTPVVLVPTRYYTTPTAAFRERGASVVIWANHLVRASLRAMQLAAARIRRDGDVMGVEEELASISELFRIQGDEELRAAEQRYGGRGTRAVVLAATRGEALGELTTEIPKTMLRVGGRPILHRTVERLREAGVHDVTVVAGYRKEAVEADGVTVVDNPDHDSTGEVASLALALDRSGAPLPGGEAPTLVLFGDVLFRPYLLELLLREPTEAAIVVDGRPPGERWSGVSDRVVADAPDSDQGVAGPPAHLVRAEEAEPGPYHHGEWTGLLSLSAEAVVTARRWIAERRDAPDAPRFETLQIVDLLNALVERGVRVQVLYVRGHWTDVDRLADLAPEEAW